MAVEQKRTYRVIGSRAARHDATDKVTGHARYGADIHLPNMLYGKVLRSPHGHARILSIDTSAAEALPGVRAIVTAADLPEVADKVLDLGETTSNLRYQSDNILAKEKVGYYGHAVAAVCATSTQIAEEALSLIKIEYEPLPVVLDVRAAMADDAPILRDEIRTMELGQAGDKPSNIASHARHALGDIDQGFAEADIIVEREFTTAMVHQGYIEPHNATALYSPTGELTVWCSTQGSFGVRSQLAEILLIPIASIRVIPAEIGGGFGGKNSVYLEPLAALLSRKSGYRPVHMTMNRAEVLAATGPTSGSSIRIKMGATAAGKITAAQVWMAYEAGCYPGSPVDSAAGTIIGAYKIDHVLIDAYDVLVNKPRTAAYRAPGATNAAFASEAMVDELARQLNIDPLDFRLMNAAREGDRRPDGPAHISMGGIEVLTSLKQSDHYKSPLQNKQDNQGKQNNHGKRRGRGVAMGFWTNWGGRSAASASINDDGSVSLLIGSVDLSGARTSTAMQLAETLGLSAEDIVPQVGDTNSVGYTEGTYGSRTTFATGWAAYECGLKLIAELKQRAAKLWEIDAETIDYQDGKLIAGARNISFKEMAMNHLDETGGPVMVSAAVFKSGYGPALAAHLVDVEVDEETGKVEILRYTAAQDVGQAIHPDFVEGQIQGGVVQGIGWALNEEYVYDAQGRLLNASFLDYRMPTALDVPMIDTIIVEVPSPNHPYGVRGVGEVPIVPPPAAIGNAIHNAIGVRMEVLPMSPAHLLEAIWAKT